MYNPRPFDLESFSEKELQIAGYTHMPTDYYRNTVMEPEAISTLRPSFGEYEAMGERHEALTSQIDSLNQAMKMSRQRGAFQALQDQMKAVKRLVKEREEIDAQMSVADLARKKTDDHKIAAGLETSYSEQLGSVGDRISQLETLMLNFAEQSEGEFDFTRCVRPDGSAYGTRGKCKKGAEAAKEAAPVVAKASKAAKPVSAKVAKPRGPVDHDARIAKHLGNLETAKANFAKVKAALKEHKGRGPQARAKKQILEHLLYVAQEKMDKANMKAIDAKIAKNKAAKKA